jgi:chromosomal replication initiator protein
LRTSEREVVAALAKALAQRIGEPRFNFWFGHNTTFRWEDDTLVVGVPNHFFQEWLQNKFADDVRAAAVAVRGQAVQVRFAIDPELFQAARRAQAGDRVPPSEPLPVQSLPAMPTALRPEPKQQLPKRTRHWRRLSDFVVGASNRVAHASALSVVEAPGQDANPLVLHGPVGTGKTHLLEGIYAGLRKHQPTWRVRYLTAEDFTNRFVQAMRLGKLGAFRSLFRECDALLIDDLNFLAGKRATQEEFLHTFDVLHSASRQLVVSCDCHPKLTDELSPELADRLLGGSVWGLLPPDGATRLDILRHKTGRSEVAVPEEVLQLLAEQLRGNVRELEGALQSVRHYSRFAGRAIDLALAREALGDLLRHAVRVVRLEDVDRAVCRVLRLDAGALQSRQRSWAVSHPRMLAMHLARKHTTSAYSEIGQYFGGRNHSTVVAAEKKVNQWLATGGEMILGERPIRVREVVERVERELLR